MFKAPKRSASFSESYFRNLPDLVTVIRTQDNVNGVDEIVQCVAKLPPLDRYMPNGQKARYKHATEEAKADAWTKAKVKELSSKNGHHQSEVDVMIRAYLQGETYEPKQVKKLQPKKPKAPLQAQPEAPVSLEKKTYSNIELSKSITAKPVGEVESSQKKTRSKRMKMKKFFCNDYPFKKEKTARTGTTSSPYTIQTYAYPFMGESYS